MGPGLPDHPVSLRTNRCILSPRGHRVSSPRLLPSHDQVRRLRTHTHCHQEVDPRYQVPVPLNLAAERLPSCLPRPRTAPLQLLCPLLRSRNNQLPHVPTIMATLLTSSLHHSIILRATRLLWVRPHLRPAPFLPLLVRLLTCTTTGLIPMLNRSQKGIN